MAGYPSPPQYTPQPPPQWNQGPGPQGGPPKKGVPTWLIVVLVGGFVLVFGGGVLAALAIYGVRSYITAAKTAEATNSLGQIGVDAVAAYERGVTSSRGDTGKRLCASASATVPASLASVKGKKYQSTPREWEANRARNAGFACLRFEMSAPQYFVYGYTAQGGSKPGDGFEATATADLSGNGELTRLHTTGRITPAGTLEVTPPAPR